MRTRLTYVHEYEHRGKLRRQFRYKGWHVELPGRPGSLEFRDAYNRCVTEALNRKREIGKSRIVRGSFAAVVAEYYSDDSFKKRLSKNTQGMRRRILEKMKAIAGDKPLNELQRGHIASAFLGQLPNFERGNWLKTLRGLMKFAIERDYISVDPTIGIKSADRSVAGTIHTWTEDEITQYRARHGLGSIPRLTLELLLKSCQRISDVRLMGPQHVRDGKLIVAQQKTKMAQKDRELVLPILPELAEALAATTIGNLVFLANYKGEPFSEKSIGQRFADWCDQAGLPDRCTSHGLRKAGLVRLAMAGCTEAELRSFSGHRNLGELKPYVEKVEQRLLAESAAAKLNKMGTGGANPPRIRTVEENVSTTKVAHRI
jgi:integrase